MVTKVRFLDLEGNIGINDAKSLFFSEFLVLIHIFSHVPPFFGILNFMTEIATKIRRIR
jgi:hypothetical protein